MASTLISKWLSGAWRRCFAPLVCIAAAGCFGAASADKAVAQDGDWATVLASAKKEGAVTLYTAQVPFVVERVVAGFRKSYPDIRIDVLRLPSGPLLSKVNQERASGIDGADVVIATEITWMKERFAEGNILKLSGPATANWPAAYSYGGIHVASIEPVTILYNTEQFKPAPKGYAELARPELKGKIGLSDLASTTVIAWYDWLEKQQGKDYVPKIKQLNPKFYVSTTAAQAAASGEIAVALMGNVTGVKPLISQGAPVNFIVPNPGFAFRYGIVAVGWSKRPNAAKVLADFMLSQEGQTLWHGGGESASPRPGIPGGLDASTLAPFDPAEYTPEVTKARTDYWQSIIK